MATVVRRHEKCEWIRVDFDEEMTIQCLDIVLESKILKENTAKK